MCQVGGSVSGGDVTTDCQLPVEVGPCFAYQIRWYHDPTSSTCRQFHYGGCQGNANNFFALDDCQTACIYQAADVTSVKPNGRFMCCFVRVSSSSSFLACNSLDCIAPYVDIIIHRWRFWAKSAASGSVRWCCFRSSWTVLSHLMRGRPGCLLQSAGGD